MWDKGEYFVKIISFNITWWWMSQNRSQLYYLLEVGDKKLNLPWTPWLKDPSVHKCQSTNRFLQATIMSGEASKQLCKWWDCQWSVLSLKSLENFKTWTLCLDFDSFRSICLFGCGHRALKISHKDLIYLMECFNDKWHKWQCTILYFISLNRSMNGTPDNFSNPIISP